MFTANSATASDVNQSQGKEVVDRAIRHIIKQYAIPGMTVAISVNGEKHFYNYGVTSVKKPTPVTSDTIFEIGSISKTFTATLASYVQRKGKFALDDIVSKDLPLLAKTSFDHIHLLNLGTHTAGGLPLQLPDAVHSDSQLINFLKVWRPRYAAGTHRDYSNPSIGLLGMIAAKSMNAEFPELMEKTIFNKLGMTHSYINVRGEQMQDYAQGYTQTDSPIRMTPGVLGAEAYGVRSTANDMIRFIDANMQIGKIDDQLQRAIDDTHTGYFKCGEITQDLIWEQYPYPVKLEQLLAGNSAEMIYHGVKATAIIPPLPPEQNVWINKTGSTNGFSSYVVFIPSRKLGLVMMANKNYPIPARVKAAYQILTELGR